MKVTPNNRESSEVDSFITSEIFLTDTRWMRSLALILMHRFRVIAIVFIALLTFVNLGRTQTVIAWGNNSSGQMNIPASATNVIAVAAGVEHSLALRKDGSVISWGAINHVPADATNIVAISARGSNNVALRADGQVIVWGPNTFGQTNVPLAATNVVAISAGNEHILALRQDGTVLAWGKNTNGQSSPPFELANVTAISAGSEHSLALLSSGSVVPWGGGKNIAQSHARAFPPADLTNVVAVFANYSNNVALKVDGTVTVWGRKTQPIPPAAATNIVTLAVKPDHCLALRADGKVIGWGSSSVAIVPTSATNILAIAAGSLHALAIKGDGSPQMIAPPAYRSCAEVSKPLPLLARVTGAGPMHIQWMADGVPMPFQTNRLLSVIATLGDNIAYQYFASNSLGCVTSVVSRVNVQPIISWGDDIKGQRAAPTSLTNSVAIAAGAFHGLSLGNDGAIRGWGKNNDGQTRIPPTATNATAIAAGGDHSLALLMDGSLVGWGRNSDGQSNIPEIATNITGIASGWAHNLALTRDGTVLAWGHNEYGQTNVPSHLKGVVAIAAGYYHNLALKSDGKVVAWGNSEDQFVPEAATNIVSISAGWSHSLALRADGKVLAWGDNTYGQTNIPASATNVVALAAGWAHNLALRADGTVIAWGKGFYGNEQVPANLSNVCMIAAGEDFSMAVVNTGPPVFQPSPGNISAPLGTRVILSAFVGGLQPLTGQWHHNGTPIEGATNRYLIIPITEDHHSGQYSLLVTNGRGETNTYFISLSIQSAPYLETAPESRSVPPWNPLELTATVCGVEPLTFQWRRDGTNLIDNGRISGVNESTLKLNTAEFEDRGDYYIVASNAFGSITGLVAQVSVSPILVWGDNSGGQHHVPEEATDIAAISSGGNHCVALTKDGNVLAWGDNTYGQNDIPPAATNIHSINDGFSHTVAVKTDGSVIAWGKNDRGQCNIPISETNITAAAAGRTLTLLLRSDHTVSGVGMFVFISGTNVLSISADSGYALLQQDGTVYPLLLRNESNLVAVTTTGSRLLGLRADTTVVDRNFPDEVPATATNVIAITSGAYHGMALRSDGTIIAWGENYEGQTRVPSAPWNFVAIEAGQTHSMAMVHTTTNLLIFRHPQSTAVAVGDTAMFQVFASGRGPLEYQWQKDGSDIESATNSTYLIPNVEATNAGSYTVIVRNPVETTNSLAANLTVDPGIPILMPALISENELVIRWNAIPGRNYQLQFKSSLEAPTWTDLSTRLATEPIISTTNGIGANAGYYRVILLP